MICRDPVAAEQREHDLIVVGGGIYGVCVTLEAARRGLRPLLLERADFGGATSWNSLRILHGGLRYLQSADLQRFRDSVRERRWFCRTFPELIAPLECVMPLYGEGLKRPLVMGTALIANDLFSCTRNVGVDSARSLHRSRLLTVAETISRFPLVDRRRLRGAALWHDAAMLNSQRVLIEMLHWACGLGATALNYVEASAPVRSSRGISGVLARDTLGGRTYAFSARALCNCAGPWAAEVAARFDDAAPELFRPSLAFNLLVDREPPSMSALAVAPRRHGAARAPVYFLYPSFGRLLAGTVHVPWKNHSERPQPTEEQIQRFIADLNAAVPGLDLRLQQVSRVFAGLLPVVEEGTATLCRRPVIRLHHRGGRPERLVSISGVKFTTARLVAERALAALGSPFDDRRKGSTARPPLTVEPAIADRPPRALGTTEARVLKRILSDEAVMTMDDLLFRRTSWGITEQDLDGLRRRVAKAVECDAMEPPSAVCGAFPQGSGPTPTTFFTDASSGP